MRKKDRPLVVVQVLKKLKDYLKEKVDNNDYLIIETESRWNITIGEKDVESSFYFELGDTELVKETPIFEVKIKPASSVDNDNATRSLNEAQIRGYFEGWVNIIESYNDIVLSPEDQLLKSYEEKFFTEFEIVDDNADSEPFNLEQQL